ncbi:MAG: heavy metal translocating P-type ATPase, partial [Bacteroidales bacterium]|nr:heavy metal translocating P-type ATPase [Bacteroidales bacterium]
MAKGEHKIVIPLEGVDNEHNALIVTHALARIRGIDSCRVEVNNKRVVLIPQNAAAISEVVKAIRALGYEVPTVRKSFDVLEMSCAACAVSVESLLTSLPGVVKAGINYATASATVDFIPEVVRAEALKKAVQSIGYDLLIEDNQAPGETAESFRQKKYHQLKRRTFLALAFCFPLLVIGMFFMDMPFANWIMWALSTPVLVWLGRGFFINAWKQLRHRSAGMDTLVALSTGVAYIFSVFNTFYPQFWHQRGLHAHVYFEASAVIVAFILLGRYLEEKAKAGTSSALKKLMGLQPSAVTVIHPDGSYDETAVENVEPGNIIM